MFYWGKSGDRVMESIFTEFDQFLSQEKKLAQNSLEAYRRDIRGFGLFLRSREIHNLEEVNSAIIVAFILSLKNENRSPSTINRKVAAIRSLFHFLIDKGFVSINPALNVKSPRVEKKPPEYLSIEEVENLLAQPDDSNKGVRDKAILELLYATGMRVSEIIEMDVNDANTKMGFVACSGEHGKARIIPLGRPARAALETYVKAYRCTFVKDEEQNALYVNYAGDRLTRQGLWKIIKYYADKAGIDKKITPQILRHSFAVHMIQNGADIKSIQELLGHEDVTATQVYLIATKNRIKEVYDKSHPRAI